MKVELLGRKQFLSILHSLADVEYISFSCVYFYFEDLNKINYKTRFSLSTLAFNDWLDVDYDFLENLFYTLSSNKSLCESLKTLRIYGKILIDEMLDKRRNFEKSLVKMGFKSLKVEIDYMTSDALYAFLIVTFVFR